MILNSNPKHTQRSDLLFQGKKKKKKKHRILIFTEMKIEKYIRSKMHLTDPKMPKTFFFFCVKLPQTW
jgi:hypothetical protein